MNADQLENVIRECVEKHRVGQEKYGELDVAADKRDFLDEAIDELVDSINYMAFKIVQLRMLKAKLRNMPRPSVADCICDNGCYEGRDCPVCGGGCENE